MNTAQNHSFDFSWDEIPSIRRHIYFYLTLVLGLMLVESLHSAFTPPDRQANAAAPPPRLTSQEVYPAPVPALSPKPSDSAQ